MLKSLTEDYNFLLHLFSLFRLQSQAVRVRAYPHLFIQTKSNL
nr:MAG TPA: hypothetical protein [Caudoviricetes sp.]